ncbi:MAG: hypothetical protein LBH11_01155, partial [Propionibacteriaceae bacterium]|nr:hypothetical protein [Propionibacteriaceae bacterium]
SGDFGLGVGVTGVATGMFGGGFWDSGSGAGMTGVVVVGVLLGFLGFRLGAGMTVLPRWVFD